MIAAAQVLFRTRILPEPLLAGFVQFACGHDWVFQKGSRGMASHFQNYVSNFNRVRLSEMIDYYALQSRIEQARPSLVVNPLTSLPYDANEYTPSGTIVR